MSRAATPGEGLGAAHLASLSRATTDSDPDLAPDHDPDHDPDHGQDRRRSGRDWLVDSALFVLALLFGLLLVDQESSGPRSDALLAADLVFGSMGCLAL